MGKQFDIGKFNKILEEYNQQLRAESIIPRQIVLSNGLVLETERDVRLCKKRVLVGHSIWKENFDKLYSLDEQIRDSTEKECRSYTSKKGGLNCQNKYGDKIKNNLNTGTPWNKGKKLHYDVWNKGQNKHNNKTILEKISQARMGDKNPVYGKKLSEAQKKHLSDNLKLKIKDGTFTPNVKNSQTHWTATYNGYKFRSSWEALFFAFNENLLFETVRISYTLNGNNHTYIVDFEDRTNQIIYEIRPSSRISNNDKEQAKFAAAEEWAKENNYSFFLINEKWFLDQKIENVDTTLFDEQTLDKIRYYYEIGFDKENRQARKTL